jgi:membrane protein implicated in regulation of membrane protease activity
MIRLWIYENQIALGHFRVISVLALVSACYCFWLMDNPLSYRWVPVVVTGFLLAIFVFILSLIISSVALVKLRRSLRASNPQPMNTA